METLLDLQNDFLKNRSSKHIPIMAIIGSASTSPLSMAIALKALQKLVLMPTTYWSEKKVVELKTKKRNVLKCVDSLMRVALEESFHPRFEKLVVKVQEHPSH